jgi:hypothetical protein
VCRLIAFPEAQDAAPKVAHGSRSGTSALSGADVAVGSLSTEAANSAARPLPLRPES